MTRKTAPRPLRSMKTLARNRARPGNLVGEVGVVLLAEFVPVLLRHDRLEQASIASGVEHGAAGSSGCIAAVLANQRRHARRTGGGRRRRRSHISRNNPSIWALMLQVVSRNSRCVRLLTMNVAVRGLDVAKHFRRIARSR